MQENPVDPQSPPDLFDPATNANKPHPSSSLNSVSSFQINNQGPGGAAQAQGMNSPINMASQVLAEVPPAAIPPIDPYKQPRSKKKFIILGIVLFILLLILGTATVAVLAAYEKIKLPNAKLQEGISYYVINLPFMPKTTKYVLEKTALVHKDLSSAYVKSSFATKSKEVSKMLGLTDFDMAIEGPVDFKDTENPKAAMNIKLTKELDLDLSFLDKVLYFKLNKIPSIAYTYLGLTADNINSNPILNKWVSYDTKAMDTEARAALEKKDKEVKDPAADSLVENNLIVLANNKILPKMKMTEEDLDGAKVYKIDMMLTPEDLAGIQSDLARIYGKDYGDMTVSDSKSLSMVKDFEVTLWIDKAAYQLKKGTVLFTVYSSSYQDSLKVLGASTIADTKTADSVQFAWTIALSDLGKNFDNKIVKPTGAVTFDQYMLDVSKFYQQSQRRSDPNAPGEDDFSGFQSTNTRTNGLSDPVMARKNNESIMGTEMHSVCQAANLCFAQGGKAADCNSYNKLSNAGGGKPAMNINGAAYAFSTAPTSVTYTGTLMPDSGSTTKCVLSCTMPSSGNSVTNSAPVITKRGCITS